MADARRQTVSPRRQTVSPRRQTVATKRQTVVSPRRQTVAKRGTVVSTKLAAGKRKTAFNPSRPVSPFGDLESSARSPRSCMKRGPQATGAGKHDARKSIFGTSLLDAEEDQIMVEEELHRLSIFKNCEPTFVGAVAKVSRQSVVPKGHVIVTAVTPAASLLVILRGVVEVLVSAEPVALLHMGEYFGDAVMLGIDSCWHATYSAKQACTICEICRDDFDKVLSDFPEAGATFIDMKRENVFAGYAHAGTLESTISIFSGWTVHMLKAIEQDLLRKFYFPGERLLVEGAKGDELYMVVKGEVTVCIAGKVVRSLTVDVCDDELPDRPPEEGVESINNMSAFRPSKRESTAPPAFKHSNSGGATLSKAPMSRQNTGGEFSNSPAKPRKSARPSMWAREVARPSTVGESFTLPATPRKSTRMQTAVESVAALGRLSTVGQSSTSAAAPRRMTRVQNDSSKAGALRKGRSADAGSATDSDHLSVPRAHSDVTYAPAGSSHAPRASLKRDMIPVNSSPLVFGELGLLGASPKRSATVTAETICQVRILYRKTYLSYIEHAVNTDEANFNQTQAIGNQLEGSWKRSALDSIKQVSLFIQAGCQEPFMEFMAGHLEERIFIAGQAIIREGDESNESSSLFVLSRGRVKVVSSGFVQAILDHGATFGEQTCFGLASRRTSTVLADQLCLVHVLHPSVVMRGLEVFPDERRKVMRIIRGLLEEKGSLIPMEIDTMAEDTKYAFKQIINKSALGNTCASFVEELSCVAEDRIYAIGDQITQEGQRSSSMFVMGSGRASVWQRGNSRTGEARRHASMGNASARIGTLQQGDICGELSMLGVLNRRLATIQADTICTMWEVSSEHAMRIIERHPDALKYFCALVNNHLRTTVINRIIKLPLLSQFNHKALTLLGMYSDARVYFLKQIIAREGRAGNTCYVINFGSATLEKTGVVVKTYQAGSHFGCSVMLGIEKSYCGTLFAYKTCHVICITHAGFLQVLEQYPSAKAKDALKQSEAAAAAELRANSTHISARKRIWARYQTWVTAELVGKQSDTEMLGSLFNAWRERADCLRDFRIREAEELDRRTRELSEWLEKKRAAEERARQIKAEEQLVLPEAPRSPRGGPRSARNTRNARGAEVCSGQSLCSTREEGLGVTEDASHNQFAALMREWPAPKPSPHYNLRLWGILVETMKDPAGAGPMLPVLLDRGRPATVSEGGPERMREGRRSMGRPQSEGMPRGRQLAPLFPEAAPCE